jgi:hypothetical protein
MIQPSQIPAKRERKTCFEKIAVNIATSGGKTLNQLGSYMATGRVVFPIPPTAGKPWSCKVEPDSGRVNCLRVQGVG